MPAYPHCMARGALVAAALAAVAALGGCGSYDSASRRIAGALTPYRPQIVQGNFVSREQVEALRPGMSRQQVQAVLGTPLVASVFHADRWDYVFTLRRAGVPDQSHRLTVFFDGDLMARFEGDALPSESEFVGLIDQRKGQVKVPVLEATEEQLKRHAAPAKPAAPEPPPAPARADYPPLEPAAR